MNHSVVYFRCGQTCNHMAALLFKVDFCWQYGYVSKSCTALPCSWKEGGKSLKVEPSLVRNMDLIKPKASRAGKLVFNVVILLCL